MMLLSGGKDSTYALCRLVEMGLRVYAFTFDNGYISEQAKDNIRRVVAALGVEHEFATTPAMNAIFRDSLMRFSNVCNGCFKTIYTLSMNRARELGIPIIVTGLSRGQFFETRLTPDLFRDDRCGHRTKWMRRCWPHARPIIASTIRCRARSTSRIFQDDRIFEEVQFVDFYRYCDAGLDEILSYLTSTVPWMRPVGHRPLDQLSHQRGRHLHPYEGARLSTTTRSPTAGTSAWATRRATRRWTSFEDELDMSRVRSILSRDRLRRGSSDGCGGARALLPFTSPRTTSGRRSCASISRRRFRHRSSRSTSRVSTRLPLTPNGKIDEAALRAAAGVLPSDVRPTTWPPRATAEERIAAIWQDVLRARSRRGADQLLRARRHVARRHGGRACGFAASSTSICLCRPSSRDPTVAQLAERSKRCILDEVAALSDEEAERLAAEPDAGT